MTWVHRVFLALVFLPILAWVLSAAGALFFSELMGCPLSEGGVQPCVLGGMDFGGLAATLFVFAAWGLLLVLPVSLGAGVLWGVVAVLAAFFRKRG